MGELFLLSAGGNAGYCSKSGSGKSVTASRSLGLPTQKDVWPCVQGGSIKIARREITTLSDKEDARYTVAKEIGNDLSGTVTSLNPVPIQSASRSRKW